MNVALLTRSLAAGDGAAEHAVTLVGALTESGDSVTVVTAGDDGRSLNADVRRVNPSVDGHSTYTGAMLRTSEFVRAAIRVAPYDVIHAIDWETVPAGLVIARRLDRPLVVTFQSAEHNRGFASPESGLISEMEWCGAFHAAAVIATNDDTRDSLAFDLDVPADKLRTIDPFEANWAAEVRRVYETAVEGRAAAEVSE